MIHVLFEQSATFKEVFEEMGHKATNYDISNEFGKTDNVVDLFKEIEKGHAQELSIFDKIEASDLVFAFFPCTYFSGQNDLIYSRKVYNFRNWSEEKIDAYIDERLNKREEYLELLFKLIEISEQKGFKMIVENPYVGNYLRTLNVMKSPDLVIRDRTKLGDHYKKPTMFYFYNFEPTFISQYQIVKPQQIKKVNDNHGIQRSLIHKNFARNFINKYIFGIGGST